MKFSESGAGVGSPLFPLYILKITILLLISASPLRLMLPVYKSPHRCGQWSALLPFILWKLCSLALAPLLLQVWSNFSVHKDDSLNILAFWFLDLINSSEPHLHFSAVGHPPGFILELITTWNCTTSNIFIFIGINFQKWTFRVHENVLYIHYLQFIPS